MLVLAMGRLYGKVFVGTFTGDAAKGIIVVFVANWFEFGTTVELLALLRLCSVISIRPSSSEVEKVSDVDRRFTRV